MEKKRYSLKRTETRTLSDKVWLFFKGLAMGAANKVPGVSGGVVAFVAGFYEEFIYSLQKLNGKAIALLFRRGFKSFYQYVNGRFLSILFLGMVASFFSVSKLLDYLIDHYEIYVWSAFFGMIIGSIYYIARDFDRWTHQNIAWVLIGVAVGISISFLEPATQNDNLWFVFLCGVISVSGMTLPGFSGSFILILIGNYVLLMVDAVNALYDTLAQAVALDFSFTGDAERMHLIKVLLTFAIGGLAGLITFSQLLGYLLRRYKYNTYAIIIGFIAGSLGVVWPWKKAVYALDNLGNIALDADGDEIVLNYTRYWPDLWSGQTALAVFFILLGVSIVLGLAWYGRRQTADLSACPSGRHGDKHEL